MRKSLLYFLLLCCLLPACEKTPGSEPYVWKNVAYGGGGFVDGIVFHPAEKGLCYCRTDMGGAYRRDSSDGTWIPLLDWLPARDANLMGVESIALDPSDPDKLYLACGTYTNDRTPDGAILRSSDRGATFQRTDVPFKMGGNEDGRGNGERMAVDPVNRSILFLGTRKAGLWRSADGAVTWNRVESFPDVTELVPAPEEGQARFRRPVTGSGIVFVLFDPAGGSVDSACTTIYVGVSLMKRENFFVSRDGGSSWKAVAGQPQQYRPNHAVLGSDGMIFLSYGDAPGPSGMRDGGVWKYNTNNGEWTDITPDRPLAPKRSFGYAAVTVDPSDPQRILASSYNRYGVDNGEDIFYSHDGGQSWIQVFGSGGKTDPGPAPYTAHTGIHWLFDLEIDPFDPDHALFTTGYGGHETFDLSDVEKGIPTVWTTINKGIEETVPLELLSPPSGAQVITAIGDYGGGVHFDLSASPPEGNFSNPAFGNTNSLACAWKNPEILIRSGRPTGKNPGQSFGYSLDGGQSWQPAPLPDSLALLGRVAVSCDGSVWYWTPDPVWEGRREQRSMRLMPVFRTTDRGQSWSVCKGIDPGIRVIADPENPLKAYGMDLFRGILYSSIDGGDNFTVQPLILEGGLPDKEGNRGDSRGGQDWIYAAPGREGDLWIAAFDGLYHLAENVMLFEKEKRVEEIRAFGFGKEAPGKSYPCLYLAGKVEGQWGIFRSCDVAASWVRINDDQHQFGHILQLTGDPKIYGRLYVGTHGRGTLYGDPVR